MNGLLDFSQPLQRTASLATLLIAAWFLYQPALGGAFMLDDLHNLGGLSTVTDPSSAAQYVFNGIAGPLGRPVALASFALQADSWGVSARPFLTVNVMIHILNGLLAYLFFLQLAAARRFAAGPAHLAALGALAVWLLMPLLATSSLMVVQRMTTLAALWMLVGLNGYLHFRRQLDVRPQPALAGMSVSLVLATALAVLSKENGALLPGLVLVTEACLLSRPVALSSKHWLLWRSVFLLAPVMVIAAFLLKLVPYDPVVVKARDFTAYERLITEARVLWDYVLGALFPRGSSFSPFHDDYPVSRSILEPAVLLATTAWAAVIAGAIVLRRRVPLFSFAVGWFLVAHLLESTTVPLYLYFEHRNYSAMLGPAFAVAAGVVAVSSARLQTALRVLLAGFVIVNGLVLLSITSTWGKPQVAAGLWQIESPDSAHALSFLVRQQVASGNPDGAIVTISRFVESHPEYGYLRLPQLTLSCSIRPGNDHAAIVATLKNELRHVSYSHNVASQLEQLNSTISTTPCKGVDTETMTELAQAVIENPRFRSQGSYLSVHHQLLARFAFEAGELEVALAELQAARDAGAGFDIHLKFVSVLLASGKVDEARRYLAEAESSLPVHPVRRIAAKALLKDLHRWVDSAAAAG